MSEKPPADTADHAEDFSHRYALEMDYLTAQRMRDLGIPDQRIGTHVPLKGYAAFVPNERTAGGNDAIGGLTLDSGVFNPEVLGTLPGGEEWAKARLRDRVDAAIAHEHVLLLGLSLSCGSPRDRVDAAIAHEHEEARRGGRHIEALEHAPDTELPIREGARYILRAMKGGER